MNIGATFVLRRWHLTFTAYGKLSIISGVYLSDLTDTASRLLCAFLSKGAAF